MNLLMNFALANIFSYIVDASSEQWFTQVMCWKIKSHHGTSRPDAALLQTISRENHICFHGNVLPHAASV